MTATALLKYAGISIETFYDLVDDGKIHVEDNRVPIDLCETIKTQRETYTSVNEFAKKQQADRYNPNKSTDRNKLIDFLEINNYFGVPLTPASDIIFVPSNSFEKYIYTKDIELLTDLCKEFLCLFGYSNDEIIKIIMDQTNGKPNTIKLLQRFIDEEKKRGWNTNVPSVVQFVRTICGATDILSIKDAEIVKIYSSTSLEESKILLLRFLDFVRERTRVKYNKFRKQEVQSKSIDAYGYRDFTQLAKILFNKLYDKENHMTEKALDNSTYAKTWLYLAIHYVCGWRSADICTQWKYPQLDKENVFNISIYTLKEDLLNGLVSDEILTQITDYVINSIDMASNVPAKTSAFAKSILRVEILPDLKPLFGKLVLICEYHQIESGNGYLSNAEVNKYKTWLNYKPFFGQEMFDVFGKRNISSRGLNKSFLQSLEVSARYIGETAITAHVIAAFSRNHQNIDSLMNYLRDHKLNGETAGFVLYMMMQRGVFGAYAYTALIEACPDSFKYLSAKEQTELIKATQISTYEIETCSTILIAEDSLKKAFNDLNITETSEILKAMIAIGFGRGKSKDEGVYCLRRALGKACENPGYKSCIENLCPYHVFTRYGLPALVDVIKDYVSKYEESGNTKYNVALKTKIIPAFQQVINEIMKDMNETDRHKIKKLIKEKMDE
jgi:hypothetical protein